ncbi:hypothetical protein POM88_003776 [Heracleum sosnowskyi]|uniref:CCHC-type domain-containing protein n=1 Tax=Heracleum sosnowskyi TaxID=360622 RepID=A0AAD8JK93_9APIA|nr:hypothetical protein POM88_003776 [Heracleum sosnowskyi]
MKEIAPKCHEWVSAKPKTQWTRAAFRTHVHSDMIQVRRDKLAVRDTVICPSALKKLNKAIQYAAVRNEPWENYIHNCYSKELYMKLYSCTLEPIKDDAIKKAVEEGIVPIIAKSTCVCKICNQPGHNSRTCKVKKQQQQGASINGLKPSNIVSVKQLFCGQHCIMTALEVNTLTLCQ